MSSSDLGAKSSYIIQFRIHCIDECLAIQDLRGTFTGLQSVQVALPPLAHVVKAMSQPLFFKSIETFLAQKKGLSASVKTKKKNKDSFDKCHFDNNKTETNKFNTATFTHLRSRSSSPKLSRQTEPQIQTRSPLIMIMTEESTIKNIPVPLPQSSAC